MQVGRALYVSSLKVRNAADTLGARYHKLVLVLLTLCISYEYVMRTFHIRYLFVQCVKATLVLASKQR